jgi:muramoyltetrapeptide carboxypeptidase
MLRPPFLKKGDKIGIAAPARKVSPQEMEFALGTLRAWGLEPVLSPNLYGEHHQFSGTDEQRAADLQLMLDDASIKALISARGGYGTLRLVDRLDFSAFRAGPKWIIGYSDITVLHSHIHNMGIETLHATMLINFDKDTYATDTLKKALFGERLQYSTPAHRLNRDGKCEGEMVGGNLSLLYALSASKSEISTKGKILFLEDLDEYLYHIDRMMLSLKRSGKLDQLAGLAVGGMTDMKDNAVPFGKNAEEIILDAVKDYSYPVCFGIPAGHITKNYALPFGRRAQLNVSGGAELSFS